MISYHAVLREINYFSLVCVLTKQTNYMSKNALKFSRLQETLAHLLYVLKKDIPSKFLILLTL